MMLTGQNGILNRAGEAKDKTGQAQKDENEKLSGYESVINDYGGSSEDTYVPIEDISDEIDGLPQKKTAEELPDYIPIYTTEQFLKVASGETCEIKDTNGVSKGTYTMSVDAKYALMNDLDFESQSSKPIKNFVGEFEGNGCIITNVNINTSSYGFVSPETGYTISAPAGLFEYVANGKISNLAVTNSSFYSIESKGAIVGQGDNISIENCYSKNNSFSYNSGSFSTPGASGSIIGYVYKNGATINNCKAIYSKWVSKDGNYFGGICGSSNGPITISNCKVVGDNSEYNRYEGGIINCAFENTNILNCSVQNIQTRSGGIIARAIKNNSDTSSSSEIRDLNIVNCSVKGVKTTSGVVSYIDTYFKTNIDGCKVENLIVGNVNSYYNYNCGICSTSGGKITINNCSVIGDGSENNEFDSGIIATAADNTNISNCRVQGIRVKSAGIIKNAVVLIGMEKPEGILELNISNCSVKNTYTKTAGILGYSANYFKTNITKCKAENLTLDGISTSGVIAAIISNDSRITDCIVKDIDIATNDGIGVILGSFISINYNEYNQLYIANCKVENIKIDNTNNTYTGFGGIIGNSERKVIIENCSVSNIEGEVGNYAGGIAGNINGYGDIGKSEIKKCSASDIKIKAANSKNGTANVGGIVGYGYFIDISDCDVSNSKIEIGDNIGGIIGFESTGTISNCTTKNINLLTEKGRIGGIIGGTNETAVENCNVYGGSIIATNGYNGLGGICGIGINVSNCIVENLQIDAPNTIGVGGIVGNGKNEVSTSLIQKCKVKSCKIKGKDYVGGIAGAAFINISDCQVEDSTIEGTDCVGGIQGFGGKFRSTDRYIPIRIDKGEVTNTEIKGSTNVNKIQGQNTYIINSTDPTQDTITNCKYNGSDISQ